MNVFLSQSRISAVAENQLLHAGRSRPVMIICETINSCNLDCMICAYSLQDRQKESMSMSLFEKVLRDYEEMGGGYLSLTPTVGDIFLDARLVARLKAIERYPSISSVSVTTNAVLAARIPTSELDSIVARMSKIQVSIYGLDCEEYQLMTRRDSYGAMVDGVRAILERIGDSRLTLGFRLLRSRSEEEIRSWIQDTFGCDIPFAATTRYANWGGALDVSKALPHDAEWIPINLNRSQCAIPMLALQVSSNGEVSFCPCDDFRNVEELRLGNVRDSTLADMYDSPKVAALYDFESRMPAFCRNCSFHMPVPESATVKAMCVHPLDFIGA